ncbi:MAG: hypothetical protein K5764_10060 [Prevotella sp.]|nr:hypothetical protein [Prevotella sp.]
MKKMMIVAILISGSVLNAHAQYDYDNQHELAISIGTGSTSQIFNFMSDFTKLVSSTLVSTTLTGGSYTGYTRYDGKSNTPVISAEYFHRVSKVVSVGGFVAFNNSTSDMYCDIQSNVSGSKSEEKVGEAKKMNISVLPSLKFDWLRYKYFGLYSKFGIGATYIHEKQTQTAGGQDKEIHSNNEIMFNFHASLLGLEAGSPTMRAFIELGVGEQGICQAGLRYKF